LAWLNATVQLAATEPFDANRVLHHLTAGLQQRLEGVAAAVAHLKMTFSPAAGLGGVAAVSVVRNDQVPELSEVLEEPALAGELIVNLRAEADPALLRTALTSELAEIGGAFPGISATLEHVEAFRPAPPRPVHRFVTHG
jgi:hypothetical protein